MNFLKVFVDGVFSGGKTEFVRNLSESDELYNRGIDTHDDAMQLILDALLKNGKNEIARKYEDMVKDSYPRITVPNDDGYMISCDFGEFQIDDNHMIHLFGQPGTMRIGRWDSFLEDCFGIVFVMDATLPMCFPEARHKIDIYSWQNVFPLVVAANKQDKPDAWHPDMLRIALRIDPEIPIIPCCAKTGDGVNDVMITLCETYLKRYFPAE